ncbi:hypothetical protein CORC01_07156 [Colletotrichum orchidophilum]|uniref:Uncharacterized protein n=1 Tax=Colletotrichum orchidophilum TaxID=1209926 RepID=A0A1G4B7Z4_9PEZI|nr:uncharacterized protein CORC01_07156 [Colletotrichum orchidophilum]OHE97541.1 hypothetical protein CORC01_07156 [Colletotrichum orchidophilum]
MASSRPSNLAGLGLSPRLVPVDLALELVLYVWLSEPHNVAPHPRHPITIVHYPLARFRYLLMRHVMQTQVTNPSPTDPLSAYRSSATVGRRDTAYIFLLV